MNLTTFIEATVDAVILASVELLAGLGESFTQVVELIYDTANDNFTSLGGILLATAGFALAYAGIRFIFGLVGRLTGATRGGGR